jgi:hypothetical protein
MTLSVKNREPHTLNGELCACEPDVRLLTEHVSDDCVAHMGCPLTAQSHHPVPFDGGDFSSTTCKAQLAGGW